MPRFLRLGIFACVIVLCTFSPTGYQFSIVNVPKQTLQNFINESVFEHYGVELSKSGMASTWSFTVASQGFGCLIGSLFSKPPAEKLGRKWSVVGLLGGSYLIGSIFLIISKFAGAFELILVGRLFLGFGGGVTFSVVPMYLLECTPISYRGVVGSLGFLGILIGDAFARILGGVATSENWSICLGATIFPAVTLMLMAFVFPESPKYLLLRKNDTELAEKSMGYFFGQDHVAKRKLKIQEEEAKASSGGSQVTISQALRQKVYRIPIFVSAAANAAAAAGGLFAVFSYSTAIFEELLLPADIAKKLSLALIPINLLCGVGQCFLVFKVGRRVLILSALVGIIVGHCLLLTSSILVTNAGLNDAAYLGVAALMAILIFLNLGIASTSIFLPSEMSVLSARSLTSAAGSVVRTLGILITQLAFYPMQQSMGSWVFVFFIVFSLLCLLYLWKDLPETRGKSLDEITARWMPASATVDTIAEKEGDNVENAELLSPVDNEHVNV